MRDFINKNYMNDADRLIDPEDGGIEKYVMDSNWPGATSCAISHLRAIVSAAMSGYKHVVVFEDDAVIPSFVARDRGWCQSSAGCDGEVCFCPMSWARCVEESVE